MEINKIKKEEGDLTTEEINKELLRNARVLVITDEKDKFAYNAQDDFRKLKFIQLMPLISTTPKLILHTSKFVYLAWQGIIYTKMYDKILMRITEIKPDLVHAFRVFYLREHVFDIYKPSICIYTDCKNDNMTVQFQSMLCDSTTDAVSQNFQECDTSVDVTTNNLVESMISGDMNGKTLSGNQNDDIFFDTANNIAVNNMATGDTGGNADDIITDKKCDIECISLYEENEIMNNYSDILNLVKIKRLIKKKSETTESYKKLYDEIENADIQTGYTFAQRFVNTKSLENIKTTTEDTQEAKKLIVFTKKKKILLRLLQTSIVVLVSTTKVLQKDTHNLVYMSGSDDKTIKDISTVAVLLIWDLQTVKRKVFDMKFKKIIFFKTEKDYPKYFVDLVYNQKASDLTKFVDDVYKTNLHNESKRITNDHNICAVNEQNMNVSEDTDDDRKLINTAIADENSIENGKLNVEVNNNARHIKNISNSESNSNGTENTYNVAVDNEGSKTMILINGGVVCWEFSVQLLEHVLYLITNVFSDNYLFFHNLLVDKSYDSAAHPHKLRCTLTIPEIVSHGHLARSCTSSEYYQKKDCYKDAAFEWIKIMVEKKYLDKNLLPVKRKFIDENPIYSENIKKLYNITYAGYEDLEQNLRSIKESFDDFSKFKKAYAIDLRTNYDQPIDMEEVLRKQPDCMKEFSDEIYIYTFDDSNIGIGVKRSFTGSVVYKNITVSFVNKRKLTEEEKNYLLYFQTIFFGVNFRRITNINTECRKYCYFVLPMKNRAIDFLHINEIYANFFINNVCNIKNAEILKNFLIFNPINKMFYEYERSSNNKLDTIITEEMYKNCYLYKDRVEETSELLKRTYLSKKPQGDNRWGQDSESRVHDNVSNIQVNRADIHNLAAISDDSNTQKVECKTKVCAIDENADDFANKTYLDYFERIYRLELKDKNPTNNAIIEACVYSAKNKSRKPEMHAGEMMYVTSINKSIKNDYKRFLEYFNVFETVALAQEFIEAQKLDISLSNTALSFTCKNIVNDNIDLGYERLEFIGDSILKYSITKYLFTECKFKLNRLVSTKDSLICNDYLYQISQKIGLKKYFSFNKYSDNLFQPPCILEILQDHRIIDSLRLAKIFQNNNQYCFAMEHVKKKVSNSEVEYGKKVYADIIESLIGVHYIEYGFEKAWHFIKKLGVLKLLLSDDISENTNSKHQFSRGTDNMHVMSSATSTINNIHDANATNQATIDTIRAKEDTTIDNEFICDYEGILSVKNISLIEDIIDYKFKNKGFVEKAMIHPSFSNNLFGSERFQKLELVGDCFLDVKVSDYIYNLYTTADPCELHTHRKRLVNNHTFAMILFKTGLVNLAKSGLSEVKRGLKNNRVSKCYSDIFEALAGAVVLDANFCFESTQNYFNKMIYFMKENSYEC